MKPLSKANFKKHVKSILLPEGFTSKFETENLYPNGSETMEVFILKSDTVEIRFDQLGCGHTIFSIDGTQYSFDRHGVEDSFYHLPWGDWDKDVIDLNEIIAEQLERINEQKKYQAQAIDIPGIPFNASPSRLVELKKQLQKRGQISFMPSGFGTGYVIATRSGSGSKRAPASTEKFFSMSPLFISTFDAD